MINFIHKLSGLPLNTETTYLEDGMEQIINYNKKEKKKLKANKVC